MKILFIYSTLSFGGVESVIRDRMQILLDEGHEVWSLFFKDRNGLPLFIPFEDRVKVFPSKDEQLQLIHDINPEWIIHFDTPDLVEEITRQFPNSKQIYEVHTTIKRNLVAVKNNQFIHQLRAMVVPSKAQAQLVDSITGNQIPIHVIPNGLPDYFFHPYPGVPKINEPVVFWIGRLETHKNWKGFVDIGSQVIEQVPNARFWLIGGKQSLPEQHQMLWVMLKKLGLIDHFRWFPEVPRNRMPQLMQFVAYSGGCFLSTSRAESFGLSILEAMASGCPIVAPRLDALLELVVDGREGILYPPGDLNSAANSVIRLITSQDTQQQMGEAARKRAGSYSVNQVVQQFLGLLLSLDGGG